MRDSRHKAKDFYDGDLLVAKGYTRVVCGKRGKYLEIPAELICDGALEVLPEQAYRYSPKWRSVAYYGWNQTTNNKIKIYEQFRVVAYADYLVGYFYVSPSQLQYEGELYEE